MKRNQLIKKVGLGLLVASLLGVASLSSTDSANAQENTGFMTYQIQSGDYLYKIDKKFGVSVDQLMTWNHLKPGYMLHPGDVIKIKTDSSENDTTYTVQPGDSLWKISQKFNMSVAELKKLNGLGVVYMLHPGDTLKVIEQTTSDVPEDAQPLPKANAIPTNFDSYVVQSGDSLWKIANRFGISLGDLTAWNQLGLHPMLHPNDILTVKTDQLNWVTDSNDTDELTGFAFDKIQQANAWKYYAPEYTYQGKRIDNDTVQIDVYEDRPERILLDSSYRYNKKTNILYKMDWGMNEWIAQ